METVVFIMDLFIQQTYLEHLTGVKHHESWDLGVNKTSKFSATMESIGSSREMLRGNDYYLYSHRANMERSAEI